MIHKEGIGNMPGYSAHLENQTELLKQLQAGFSDRWAFLEWKTKFTHLIFGQNGIEDFEALTCDITEPFLYGELKNQENAIKLRGDIADALRRKCLSFADKQYAQRAQEINVPEKGGRAAVRGVNYDE